MSTQKSGNEFPAQSSLGTPNSRLALLHFRRHSEAGYFGRRISLRRCPSLGLCSAGILPALRLSWERQSPDWRLRASVVILRPPRRPKRAFSARQHCGGNLSSPSPRLVIPPARRSLGEGGMRFAARDLLLPCRCLFFARPSALLLADPPRGFDDARRSVQPAVAPCASPDMFAGEAIQIPLIDRQANPEKSAPLPPRRTTTWGERPQTSRHPKVYRKWPASGFRHPPCHTEPSSELTKMYTFWPRREI